MENKNIDNSIKKLQKNPKLINSLNYEQLQAVTDYLLHKKYNGGKNSEDI